MEMTVSTGAQTRVTSGHYESLLRKLDDFADRFGVNGTEKMLEGEGVNVVRTTSSAKTFLSVSQGAPVLDPPKSSGGDAAWLNESVAFKLTSAPPARTSYLFNLYAIMELMQDVAQRLRDSMRELRQAELAGIQANILSQAAAQKNAAVWQMAVGLTAAVAQGALAVFSLCNQMKSSEISKGPADEAKFRLDSVKVEAELADQAVRSDVNIAKQQADLTNKISADRYAEIREGMTFSQRAEANYQTMNDVHRPAVERIAAYRSLTGDASMDKAGLADGGAFGGRQLARANEAVRAAYDTDASRLGDLDSVKVVRTEQIIKTMRSPEAFAQYRNDLAVRLKEAGAAVQNLPQNVDAVRLMNKSSVQTQFGQLVGTIGQSLSAGSGQLAGLKATELQSVEKGMEERLDQNKDLFADVMQLIQEVIRIYGDVTRAENQSLRDIMA